MPVIRVSEETLERLRKWAIPLEDSMDSALRKAIDAAEEYLMHKEGGKREKLTLEDTRSELNLRNAVIKSLER